MVKKRFSLFLLVVFDIRKNSIGATCSTQKIVIFCVKIEIEFFVATVETRILGLIPSYILKTTTGEAWYFYSLIQREFL